MNTPRHARLCAILLVFISSTSIAEKAITEFSVAAVKTELDKAAVGYAIRHKPGDDIYLASRNGFVDATPDIEIRTGGDDTFDGITAKLMGHNTFMSEVPFGDGTRTCSECRFHVMPFGVGIETDRNLENVSLLGEVGYFAVGRARAGKPRYGLNGPRAGIFLQAGYKFDSEDGTADVGGAADESDEEPDSELLRVKADVRGTFGNPDSYFTFIPAARVWYDLANSETYYSIEAAVRLHVLEGKPFEFKYEKGSGAPNFNDGEQFSAGLVISF